MPASTPKYRGAKLCTVAVATILKAQTTWSTAALFPKTADLVVGALAVAVHLDAGEIGVRSYTSPKLKTELYAQRPVSQSRMGLQMSLKI
jgi:hypothetical protein